MRNGKLGLAGLLLAGAALFNGGCTVTVDGWGDLGDWVYDVIYLDDCHGHDCGYDVIEVEYDD